MVVRAWRFMFYVKSRKHAAIQHTIVTSGWKSPLDWASDGK